MSPSPHPKMRLTQAQVAAKMKSTQSRVAKIESSALGISLELMFSGLFAVGGSVSDLVPKSKKSKRKSSKSGPA